MPNNRQSGRVTVREAVLSLLREAGATTIFGNPGSTELPMFRDFPEDFRYVLGLQESVVVAMADGFAQATNGIGVVNLHSAGGLGHALGNVFTAFRNRTPLVVIAGQQARSMLLHDPYLHARDATEFPKPYVKYSIEPARAEDVPAAVARALYMAQQPPCGPVFVSVPVDDWDRDATPVELRRVSRSIRADAQAIDAVNQALASAKSPAFVVGAEVDRAGAFDSMVELAQRHRARVFAVPHASRCSFPENDALFAGALPAVREGIVEMLDRHDVVVAIGAQVFAYHVEGQGPFVREGTQVFQLTDDPALAAGACVGTAVLCSAGEGIADMLAYGSAPARPRPQARTKGAEVECRDGITDAYVMQAIARLRPVDSILVNEAPSSNAARQAHLWTERSQGFYMHASGSLGYGLPAAVGVALGRPGEKVIATLGDGSAMYGIQGLYSAAQLGVPVTFVILNNRRYQALQAFAAKFGLPRDLVGTALTSLDFVSLARGHGCEGVHVSDPAMLDDALKMAFAATRPTLVEVEIR